LLAEITVSRNPKLSTQKTPTFVTSQPLRKSKTMVKQTSQVLRLLKTSTFEISQELVKSPAGWGQAPKLLGGLLQV